MKIKYIMVTYNKRLEDCATLAHAQDLDLYIYDNSIDQEIYKHNLKISKTHNNVTYLGTGENIGLSKAYNQVINAIKKTDPDTDYVIMLDDDTHLDPSYMECVSKLPQPSNVIYTPFMTTNGKKVNPRYVNEYFVIELFGILFYTTKEKVKKLEGSKHLFAINSAMIIPFKIFNDFHYNEQLFLDCVDDDFCRYLYQHNYHIEILPVDIEHGFHMREIKDASYEQLEWRVKNRLKDIKVYNQGRPINYFITKMCICFQYTICTKKLKFLTLIFK